MAQQAPPTPNGYIPYEDVPFSPAPYSDYAPPTASSELYVADEEGVFVSAEEVLKLQKWAEERSKLCESLAAAEQLASAREQEAEMLRKRLAELEGTKPREMRLPLNTIVREEPRHSAAEVNALATQRQVENLTKKQAENANLREEWRKLRELRAACGSRRA